MKNSTDYRLVWEVVLTALVLLHSQGSALKCYVGSKGFDKNGRAVRSFVPNDCDAEMTHCFGSYTDDFSQITASCQSLNTEQQLLDVCKEGCRKHTDLQVTICCCDSDLCNLPPEEKNPEQVEANTVNVTTEFVEQEENLSVNSTEVYATATTSTTLP